MVYNIRYDTKIFQVFDIGQPYQILGDTFQNTCIVGARVVE